MKLRYPLIVEGEEGNYAGYFPDLPGCTTGGETLPVLLKNAREALALYLEGCVERNEPWPAASEAVKLEWVEVDEAETAATQTRGP